MFRTSRKFNLPVLSILPHLTDPGQELLRLVVPASHMCPSTVLRRWRLTCVTEKRIACCQSPVCYVSYCQKYTLAVYSPIHVQSVSNDKNCLEYVLGDKLELDAIYLTYL